MKSLLSATFFRLLPLQIVYSFRILVLTIIFFFSSFQCPEPNGLFPDPEQCDLYYVCEDNVATPELCEDGLLFDTSRRNKESCKLPHGVDCGKREFVQGKKISILRYRIPCH